MYVGHFGLVEAPFTLTPNPRYLYMSERHREGLAHLLYGIQQPGGFVQLTGEVGTGKTTLCRCLLEQLPPDVDVALVLNPRLTVVEFLAALCDELHVVYPTANVSVKVLVDALQRYLLDAHARGRRTVLIVDEAQNLSAEVLEQIRLLTNLETAAEKLLQIILIGQPELIRLLEERRLRQLAQRITARYHLLPFSTQDTYAYIRHRVQVAGRDTELFTPAAMRSVRRLSGGIPRRINVLCDRALLGAYACDKRRVDATTVRRAAREIRGRSSSERRRGEPLAWIVGVAVAALVIGFAVLGWRGQLRLPWHGWSRAAESSDAHPTPTPRVAAEGSALRDGAATTASSTAAPQTLASPAVAPDTLGLADVLAKTSNRDDHPAFASLYALWGIEYRRPSSGLGCDAARGAGLECLFKSGNWNKLRRFNLPAILELTGPGGDRYRVTLVALGEDQATLAIGGREYSFPLSEVEKFWDGSFILVWKAPPFAARVISPGSRSKSVEWLRARMQAVDGQKSTARPPDIYDPDLQQRVSEFQQSRGLTRDGVVGGETLLQLVLSVREPGTPSLASRTP